ncbi:MAG: exopolysaccharide biosynthesis polyprenyl glycosylphosphotransferase [Oscillospiraceae bacterium]|nr:exopolysaccharide biosynthesis polyprenyl glycosylphosphotransferase [Oscillospiraceae bacterium]
MKTRSMKKAVKIRALKLLHLVVSVGMFIICWRFYYYGRYAVRQHLKGDLILYALYTVLLFLMNRTYDAYSLGYRKASDNTYSQVLSQVITAGIIWIVSLLMYMKPTNPLPLIGLCAVQLLWDMLWSVTAKKTYDSLHMHKRTVIIYEDEEDLRRLEEVGQLEHKFNVQKYIRNPQDYKELEKEIEGFEAIVVSGVNATLRNGLAKYCIETGVLGYFAPHVGDIIMQGSRHMRNFSVPIMSVRRAEPTPEYLFLKRVFDIVVSAIGLVVLSPFIGITALAVKLYDHGPVLYKQVRLTKDRKEFKILKFRSMRVDAEKDGVARLSTGENDDRITPVGKVIRACRADELPQLWNILRGDMSIVGPRPERPEIAAQYEEEMPAFGLRLQVKAGLTGYAQVYGKYNTNPHDKLEMDLMYINKMSIVEDLRLMFATVRVLFIKDSTEGVETGKTTAK